MKVRFISKNTNQQNTATLLSWSGKSTGKYSKAWNSQLTDGSVKSIDFEGDVLCWKRSQIQQLMREMGKTYLRKYHISTYISPWKKISREVYIRSPKETDTTKSGGFRNVSMVQQMIRYWYLRVKKSYLSLVQVSLQLTQESSSGKRMTHQKVSSFVMLMTQFIVVPINLKVK